MSAYSFEKEARIRNYIRTLLLIMLKAYKDLYGEEELKDIFVEFTLGSAIFIRPYTKNRLDKRDYTRLWRRMHEIIDEDIPVEKVSAKVSELYSEMIAKKRGREAEFLHFRRTSRVTLSKIDDFQTYFYGSLLKRTGSIKSFDIMPYEDGFFLLLPDMDEVDTVSQFEVPRNLFLANHEAYNVAHDLGIDTITRLSRNICEGKVTDLIMTSESIFDNKLVLTANEIVSKGRKFVFIAGPSSSGKTSTAHRLCFALRTFGIIPHIISLDDYYRDRTRAVKGEDKVDLESIEALDLEQFAVDMSALGRGEEIEKPEFNFVTTKREYKGDKIKLGERDILIVEGIHSLNPRISEGLNEDLIYRIYVSALSHFNIDPHNRIPSSDLRLLRRIVRDHRTRGYDAAQTIAQWPSVRDGEENNIFPYQDSADYVIDTAMVYEISAIKPYAERVLFLVPREAPEYLKAKELLKFLDFVVSLPPDLIPPASIIREFIGGSCLNVK